MNVKRLRRLFCVLLCVVIMVCSCVTASAATWENVVNGQLVVDVTYYDIATIISNTTTLLANFSAAVDYWDDLPQVSCTEVEFYNYYGGNGSILHSRPSEAFWNNKTYYDPNVAGITIAYDTFGRDISSFLDSSEGLLIRTAVIYYCPRASRYTNYTSLKFRSLHAHETGHAFGLTHSTNQNSIMVEYGEPAYAALPDCDVDQFEELYGFN